MVSQQNPAMQQMTNISKAVRTLIAICTSFIMLVSTTASSTQAETRDQLRPERQLAICVIVLFDEDSRYSSLLRRAMIGLATALKSGDRFCLITAERSPRIVLPPSDVAAGNEILEVLKTSSPAPGAHLFPALSKAISFLRSMESTAHHQHIMIVNALSQPVAQQALVDELLCDLRREKITTSVVGMGVEHDHHLALALAVRSAGIFRLALAEEELFSVLEWFVETFRSAEIVFFEQLVSTERSHIYVLADNRLRFQQVLTRNPLCQFSSISSRKRSEQSVLQMRQLGRGMSLTTPEQFVAFHPKKDQERQLWFDFLAQIEKKILARNKTAARAMLQEAVTVHRAQLHVRKQRADKLVPLKALEKILQANSIERVVKTLFAERLGQESLPRGQHAL